MKQAKRLFLVTGDRSVELPVGLDLLSAEKVFDRYIGVQHLKQIKASEPVALDALRKTATSDPDVSVREAAMKAIGIIEGQ